MKAVVFCMDAEGRAYADPFEGADCVQRARNFRASVEPDFPGAVFVLWADEEAKDDHAARLFGPDLEDVR